ncbi:hypothetical protein EV201_1235 [Ancylomarina subtilis]|uniref:Uncharacterized protein n=1 Tax=Ancylomarina subtilis TaxID=1639035 RepID=A0A4Q7VKD9_9BACT|nr:hypothetical protein [Ancylomarina subtilis]RZT96594.1 hypothetical protein EV201_1235 [Ancylomarina subtilis]
MKYLVIIILVFVICDVYGQADENKLANTIWQSTSEDYIYLVYNDNKVYDVTDYTSAGYPEGGITISANLYGFYSKYDLPSIDSLKQSGKYYFEIDPEDLEEGESFESECGEVEIYKEGDETMMNIYYSNSQQIAIYLKVDELPIKIQKYLKKKGIETPASASL